MNQDNYIEEKKNSRKDTIKNFLFAFLAGTYLIDNLTKWANDVSLQLTGLEGSFGSLFWGDLLSLNLVKIVLTTLVVGFIAAVYAYLSRDRRLSIYLILGLGLIFFAPLLLIIVAAVMTIIYGTPISWSDLAIFSGVQVDFYITLFLIQIILAVVSIKFGQKIGLGLEYLDEKDEVKNYIYGIRKFHWFLIIFPFNMLTYLAIVAVTRVLRGTVQQLISGTYSNGFEGIVSAIFFPIMAVGIVFVIMGKGIEVIRNENLTKINKAIKIIALYVLVPIALFLFIRP